MMGTLSQQNNYFERTYQLRLQFPGLPCLHVGNKQVCWPNIVHSENSNHAEQAKKIVRHTSLQASLQRKEIEQDLRDAHFDSDVDLQDFGLPVLMLPITGHVLQPQRPQAKEDVFHYTT